MHPFTRGEAPQTLVEYGEEWGKDWERRKEEGGKFDWHTVGGQKVNQLLLPALEAQTQGHCSFCDAFPVSPPSLETIEHFRPKSKFPLDAFRWENLYYCCDHCQNQKRERFDEKLLRPDAPAYRFDDYFRWDFTSGKLEANPAAPPENRERARVTIDIYGLNNDYPEVRRRERNKVASTPNVNHDDWPYRNFLFPV